MQPALVTIRMQPHSGWPHPPPHTHVQPTHWPSSPTQAPTWHARREVITTDSMAWNNLWGGVIHKWSVRALLDSHSLGGGGGALPGALLEVTQPFGEGGEHY